MLDIGTLQNVLILVALGSQLNTTWW